MHNNRTTLGLLAGGAVTAIAAAVIGFAAPAWSVVPATASMDVTIECASERADGQAFVSFAIDANGGDTGGYLLATINGGLAYDRTLVPGEVRLDIADAFFNLGDPEEITVVLSVDGNVQQTEYKDCYEDVVLPDPIVTYTDWVDVAGSENCEAGTVEQTRNQVTTPYVIVDNVAVLDPDNATSVPEYGSRPMTEAELAACEPDVVLPDPVVTYTPWVDVPDSENCDTETVAQTRDQVTTPYVLVDNVPVLDPDNATSVPESGTRPMNEAELAACEPDVELPDPKVTYSSWVDVEDGENCEAGTVEQTRNIVTTPYKVVDGVAVLDPDNATSVPESGSRPMTEAELAACEPVDNGGGGDGDGGDPVTNPGTDTPVVNTPVTTPVADAPVVVPNAEGGPTTKVGATDIVGGSFDTRTIVIGTASVAVMMSLVWLFVVRRRTAPAEQ